MQRKPVEARRLTVGRSRWRSEPGAHTCQRTSATIMRSGLKVNGRALIPLWVHQATAEDQFGAAR